MSAGRPRILLVDDESRFLATTRKVLQRRGYTAYAVDNGAAALQLLGERTIDVVVLDVKMPGLDGMATLAEIRRGHPGVDVLLLTGHGTLETAVEGLKRGAADVILKPVDIEKLIQKAEQAFARQKPAPIRP